MNGSLLEGIIEVQSGLDHTFNQILSIAADIEQKRRTSRSRTDDKHLKELKEFRREGVLFQLESLDEELRWIFDCAASSMMRKLKKPTKATPP
jgi:hypothetical protein